MRNSIKTSLVALNLALGCALAACAQTPTQESTGAYVDDTSITTKVKAAILGDPSLKVFEIYVATHKNVVELSGVVDLRSTITHAGDVAGSIAGVSSVRNNLVVR